MQELIAISKVTIGNRGVNSVDGRELHAFLEVAKDFPSWMKVQIERARLVEHRDYEVSSETLANTTHLLGGTESIGFAKKDYSLSLEAAKHIAMLSGTDKGFEVREYFIACEDRLSQLVAAPVKIMSPAEMLLAQAQAMVDQERKLAALESKVEKIEARHQCVEKELDKLPEPTIEAPKRTKFDQIKMLVADYCDRTGNKDDFRRCYQLLYHHLYTRFHVSLAACTKIHKRESMIQIAERLGYGEQLYSLAHELFAPESRMLHETESANDERILY